MGSTQEFAFRASEALEAAVRDALGRVDHWDRTVLLPWQDEHPDIAPLWRRDAFGTSADRECVGFTDNHPDRDPPAGLSRNRKRQELRPARGEAGDTWREWVDLFNTRPKVAPVFALHGVELAVTDIEFSRLRHPAILISGESGESGLWLKYGRLAPRETEHLTAIPVSEFHRAMEALDERDADRAARRADAPAPVEA